MDNFDINNEVDGEHDDDHDPVLGEDLPEGKNACYLYLDPGRRYVGKGILHNDQTNRILHDIPLEEGYVRVQFEVAEKSELKALLPRPCDEANLVGEASGYFLAWPRKLVSMKLETTPRTMDKEKDKHVGGNKNLDDKEKEKTVESIVGVSSRQLGYPLPQYVCHYRVLEFVRLAIMFDRVTDIEVEMGPYWNANPWIEHIHKENVLEVLDAQWLSSSSIIFYIRYLCEVYLSKNPDLESKYSFVSPHLVSPVVDKSDTSLTKCLLGYVDNHANKDHLILMPYNVGAMRTFRTHNRKNYSLPMFQSFRWLNVQCPKQALHDGIYCGYYVGCFVEDILCNGETKIDVNFTYYPRLKSYPHEKMLGFQMNWAGYLYNRFLKDKLLIK